MMYADGACGPWPSLLSCAYLGDEALVSPAGPRLNAGAGGRSPIAPPGRWTDHPSVGSLGRNPEVRARMRRSRFRFPRPAWWIWPSKRRSEPGGEPSRAFLRPRVEVTGQTGADPNALLLLTIANPRGATPARQKVFTARQNARADRRNAADALLRPTTSAAHRGSIHAEYARLPPGHRQRRQPRLSQEYATPPPS